MTTRKLFPFAAALLVAVASASPCAAHPESIGGWYDYYADVLGLANENLPISGEFTDEFTATVAQPAALIALGLTGLRVGDKVHFTNHYSGYWTLTNVATNRRVKTPLAWNIRFGLRPEPDLPDGEPPDRIVGRVIDPTLLAQYRFRNVSAAKRFVLEYGGDGRWLLTLEPGGESKKVPF